MLTRFQFLLLAILIGSAGFGTVQAQIPGDGETTPRAYVLKMLNLSGGAADEAELADIITDAKPNDEPNEEPNEEKGAETEITAEAIGTDINSELTVPDAEITDSAEAITDANPLAPDAFPEPYELLNPQIPAFYVSAEEYLALRGDTEGAQAILNYSVSRAPLGGDAAADDNSKAENEPQNVTVLLGDDYAASVRGNVTEIYDFKLGRLITVKPIKDEAGELTDMSIFDNTALYAGVYRNIMAVEAVTEGGAVRQIDIGDGKSLDAFWVESAMSWSKGGKTKGLKTSSKKEKFTAAFAGETAVTAEFSDMRLKRSFRASLMAFAHHEWGLHPNVIDALSAYPNAPSELTISAYGPAAPQGESEHWALQSGDLDKAEFPLPRSALGAAQRTPIAPLVFIINEAVNGRAMGGLPLPGGLKTAFQTAYDNEDELAAWTLGRRYVDYTGACTAPEPQSETADAAAQAKPDAICEALAKLENKIFFNLADEDGPNKALSDYVTALKMAKSAKTRAAAVKTLEPYLEQPQTPAAVLRALAMARSAMSPDEAKAAGAASLSPAGILETALAKDPYDPQTYLGLAQVLAGRGAFEQSWDVYDALRAGLPTAPAANIKIGEVEAGIRERAPGFFGG